MFGSCKLLLVLLLYFVFQLNVVRGAPADEESDGDGPPGPPVDGKWKLLSKQVDAERFKLNQGKAVKEENYESPPKIEEEAPKEEKKEPKDDGGSAVQAETNDSNEKKAEENNDGGRDEVGEDEKVKKIKDKKTGLSFMMEDMTASLNWPLGIIPYYLDSSIFDFIVAYNLRKAMDLIESVSCIQFKTLMLMPSENITWINITNPTKERECVHERREDGGKPGEIVMVLGFDCMKQKQILHTLLHAIGFKDEVTHPLRDQYIHVIWDNIQTKYLHLFRSQPSEVAERTMYEYDPASIMHFHDRAYSKNGQATIQPLLPGLRIGPTDTLSALDKLKFRTLFGRECNKRKIVGLQESCMNVIGKKLKSADDEAIETLKEGTDVDKLKSKKKKKKKKTTTTLSPLKEKIKKYVTQIDDPRTSEEN